MAEGEGRSNALSVQPLLHRGAGVIGQEREEQQDGAACRVIKKKKFTLKLCLERDRTLSSSNFIEGLDDKILWT